MTRILRGRGGFTLIELMIVISIIAILAAIVIPVFLRARVDGQRSACQSNLKNMSTALEIYFTTNAMRYPVALGSLTPEYLRVIPNCPAANSNSYVYTSHSFPDAFTMYCAGTYHAPAGLGANQPSYISNGGLQP